jgi:hypothetical protein
MQFGTVFFPSVVDVPASARRRLDRSLQPTPRALIDHGAGEILTLWTHGEEQECQQTKDAATE